MKGVLACGLLNDGMLKFVGLKKVVKLCYQEYCLCIYICVLWRSHVRLADMLRTDFQFLCKVSPNYYCCSF